MRTATPAAHPAAPVAITRVAHAGLRTVAPLTALALVALALRGAAAPAAAASLEGAPWRLGSYAGPDGRPRPVLRGTEVTVTFQDGRVSGSAGCNRYTAGYEVAGDALRVSAAASTQAFCPEPAGVMEQEAAYLAALPTASRYRIEGDRLALEQDDGARVATYAARAAPGPARGPAGFPRAGAGPGLPAWGALAALAALGLLALVAAARRLRWAG
jgi:heat shock protein HslJ